MVDQHGKDTRGDPRRWIVKAMKNNDDGTTSVVVIADIPTEDVDSALAKMETAYSIEDGWKVESKLG